MNESVHMKVIETAKEQKGSRFLVKPAPNDLPSGQPLTIFKEG